MKKQQVVTLSISVAICIASPSCKSQKSTTNNSEQHQAKPVELKKLKYPNSEGKIKFIISEQLGSGEDKIKNGNYFTRDLGADSLDLVELIMAVEEEFSISIPDADAEKLHTVADLIHYTDSARKK